MQKRGTLLLTLLASINFVSAISIGDFLDQIGGENILLGGTFLIAFALLNMILGRFKLFKDASGQTTKIPAIISFILSLFIIYGIRTLNFDLENLFFSIGISGDLLYQIASIIILIGLIYILYKFGKKLWSYLCWILILSGIGLIWLGLSDLLFNGEPVLIAGLVLFILGIICWWRRRKKPVYSVASPEALVTDSDRQHQIQNVEGMYNELKKEYEKIKQSGQTQDPEVVRAAQDAQRALQAAQAEAARSAEAQRAAEAARKKAEADIKIANEENQQLQKKYEELAKISNSEERDRKEKELIAAKQKADADAQKAKQEAATAQRATEAAKAQGVKAQEAQSNAKKEITELKYEEEKAKARKENVKPKISLQTSTNNAKIGEKIIIKGSWKGGVPPYTLIWYASINGREKEIARTREVKTNTSQQSLTINENVPSGKITVGILMEDSKKRMDEVTKEIKIS